MRKNLYYFFSLLIIEALKLALNLICATKMPNPNTQPECANRMRKLNVHPQMVKINLICKVKDKDLIFEHFEKRESLNFESNTF